MSSLIILIPVSIVLMCGAAWAFLWAVDNGQFDDLDLHALDLQDNPTPDASSASSDASSVGNEPEEQQR